MLNEFKKCTKCQILKPRCDFNIRRKGSPYIFHMCKLCQTNRQKEMRNECSVFLRELKGRLKCERCGQNHPATLQFHHKNPLTKKFAISESTGNIFSKSRLLAEIDKCEVLCANCHSIHHWEEKNGKLTEEDSERPAKAVEPEMV